MIQTDQICAVFSGVTVANGTATIKGLVMPDGNCVVIEVPITTISKAFAAYSRSVVEKMPVEMIRTAKNRSKIKPDKAKTGKAPKKRGAKIQQEG
jgi:hypothetical protein